MWRGARCRERSCSRAGRALSLNGRSGAGEVVAFVPEVVALAPELVALGPEVVALAPELVALAPELVALGPEVVALGAEVGALALVGVVWNRGKGAASRGR